MDFAQSGGRFGPELQMIGGVAIQYIATRLALTAVAPADGSRPGRQAVGQWLPVLLTSAAALLFRRPEVALSLIFGSSVASLSLIMGMTTYVSPMVHLPPERRLWSFVLPAAFMLLLAGFHAQLTWYHALMLLILGGAILAVWVERPPAEAGPARGPLTIEPPPLVLLPIAAALMALGAWVSVRGAVFTSSRLMSPELLAATILSPLLLLPSLGSGTMLAQKGHAERVVTSLCGTVYLNLCLLLPVVILVGYAVAPEIGRRGPTGFPMITWRVDTVVLLALGFVLLPMAYARWLPARLEAILLVIVYVGYVFVEMGVALRLLR